MMKIKLKIIKLTLLLNLKMVLSNNTIKIKQMKNQQEIVSNHKTNQKLKIKHLNNNKEPKAKSKIDKRTLMINDTLTY